MLCHRVGVVEQTVRTERRGRVLVITLDRPAKRNAMDGAMARGLAAAVDTLDAEPELVVGVLTGAGGSFCAGMDLAAFLTGDVPEVEGRGLGGITRTPPVTPLIAAVEGHALAGGFELVLACDLVVAARDATFGLPEVRRGLVAGAGGLLRLPRKVPPNIAMEHALTGEPISAEDAHRWGLVNVLTEPGAALGGALTLAARVAENAPLALRVTKRLAADSPTASAWTDQQAVLEQVLASADAQEGASAFTERRPPRWTGR